MPFLGAHPTLLPALVQKGYTEPTEVQRAILEHPDPSADLLVSAQTGSGKTVAFGLAMANELLGESANSPALVPGMSSKACLPLALVIAPTRELAQQVAEELRWLYQPARLGIATCVGGMSVRKEQQTLRRGADIVVGTPGRLCDHVAQGYLSLAGLRVVVLDEADEMLDMGFRDDLESLLSKSPPERRTLMFSATIPPGIANLAKKYQRGAQRVAVHRADHAHADIEHQAIEIRMADRTQAVVNLLRFHQGTTALVFCATRQGVSELAHELNARGFHAVSLSGELSQNERMLALAALRDGSATVCVATDVAARGIDLQGLGLVIHADLPQNMEVLTHRSGRTGRGGRRGVSVMLVPSTRRGFASRVLATRARPLQWTNLPTADEIHALDDKVWEESLPLALVGVGAEARAQAERLLARYEPALLVGAWIEQQRKRLPAVQTITRTAAAPVFAERSTRDRPRGGKDALPRPSRQPESERPHGRGRSRTSSSDDHVWFSINVGETGNASPRWLIPLLCRRGNITSDSIGQIVVQFRQSYVSIARQVAASFAASASQPDPRDKKVRIVPAQEPGPSN